MQCCVAPKKTEKTVKIEQEIRKARHNKRMHLKVLLMGTGDAGKTTFLKQLSVINRGFLRNEYKKYSDILKENTLQSMCSLIDSDRVHIPLELRKAKDEVLAAETLSECVNSIVELWNSEYVKEAFENRSNLCLQTPSNADYFFDNALRFADDNFAPELNDIFRAKLKTTGVTDISIEHEGVTLNFIDVGGQRSERRKWIHQFDDVAAIIFLAAIDEYDMTLEEDLSTNRFEESLRLFEEFTSSKFFIYCCWILFLNKIDLFREKIKKVPLHKTFSDFKREDTGDYDNSIKYIENLYRSRFTYGSSRRARDPKDLYIHHTCALETNLITTVFSSCRNHILTTDLINDGF